MAHAHPFGTDHAAHYDAQASLNVAGYPVAYELGAAALAALLEDEPAASLLFVGLGTGAELLPYRRFDVPGWRFTGVDPSEAMLAVARQRLEAEGLLSRTQLHRGELGTLPPGPAFDGAQLLGVLHHVEGEEARLALLREVAGRLAPGAPLVLGGRVGRDPELTRVELRRWQAYGAATPEALERRREALAQMQPIASDAALFAMLERTGFVAPRPLFVSLQYKVFLARRA